ncbi:hypothetical protein AB0A74_28865 [Saccharothrix sp. NPDC042600]|uniref:hypothetical protein n=1 Tax=Saccharothrix TaxID=2071 RepID=UPI00340A8F6D|nr:hypothetical protein GCM10017745_15580 [Saccharothrix mutabilis subsp. capreolus]
MALFGNRENPEAAALYDQLMGAQATINELRGWVHQLRGAGAQAAEAELRDLRAAVDQQKATFDALGASRQQLSAELRGLRSQLVETRELALLQRRARSSAATWPS